MMKFRIQIFGTFGMVMLSCMPTLFSQGYTLEGVVFDHETRLPVSLATVYINGTSIGTITDVQGKFRLDQVFLPCELILSHVSYMVRSITLRDSTQTKGLQLQLDKKIIELREATIIHELLHDEYLRKFKLWFLGEDFEEYGADILNDSSLLIHIGENEEFTVEATHPIKVILPVTGYMVTVDLVNFNVKYRDDIDGYHCSILGYYFFEPVDVESRREQRMLARARAEAFYNSSMHFCKSLYHNQLLQNGYLFERNCNPSDDPDIIPVEGPDFTGSYGQDEYGNRRLLLTRFICRDFTIAYNYNSRNRPVDLTYLQSNPIRVEYSGLRFLRDSVYLYPSGRVPENSVAFIGSIGRKGVASMLPEDYIPSMQ
jgi:hypothetical protein